MLNQRTSSVIAILLVLLSLLLLFSYGTPAWFGNVSWAIFPLNVQRWKGIWLGAFVHGSWDHLWGNVIALAIFSALFLIQFPKRGLVSGLCSTYWLLCCYGSLGMWAWMLSTLAPLTLAHPFGYMPLVDLSSPQA